jgi:YebC/PmpR family DNA-binding regulatory protein
MSGHSKWAKIKRQKGANDVRKGMMFTKMARNITLAAKEGGGDPTMNFALRIAIDKAKAVNMPSDNIERSIKKALGGDDKTQYQKIAYEAILSNGAALIIDCQTDNSNRTVADIKKILDMAGAKLASVGSVAWQFSEHGLIVIKPARLKKSEKFGSDDQYIPVNAEEIEMELLDLKGVADIEEATQESDEGEEFKVLLITTTKNDFAKVVREIENLQYEVLSFELIKKAKESISLKDHDLEKVERLINNLDDHDDVDAVWSNVKDL